jgi:hypothetical protein
MRFNQKKPAGLNVAISASTAINPIAMAGNSPGVS